MPPGGHHPLLLIGEALDLQETDTPSDHVPKISNCRIKLLYSDCQKKILQRNEQTGQNKVVLRSV